MIELMKLKGLRIPEEPEVSGISRYELILYNSFLENALDKEFPSLAGRFRFAQRGIYMTQFAFVVLFVVGLFAGMFS